MNENERLELLAMLRSTTWLIENFEEITCGVDKSDLRLSDGKYHCVTQMLFYDNKMWPDDVAYFVQSHDGKLCKVKRAMRCRRDWRRWLIWATGQDDPAIVNYNTLLYVSNEDVAGKTIEEITNATNDNSQCCESLTPSCP